MRITSILILSIGGFLLTTCIPNQNQSKLEVLQGTWKVENKENYESWTKLSATEYIGESYKIREGKKQTTETLKIKIDKDNVVYSAKVFDQNEGETISFIQNTSNLNLLSFENIDHDFPKKIQYRMINAKKMFVNVLGEGDQGFSYFLLKQN